MLSAAHVLAMDAKNLFDVVDSIRQRYQHLFPPSATKETSCSSSFESTSGSIVTEPVNYLGGYIKTSTSGDLLQNTGIYDNDLHHSFNSQLQLQNPKAGIDLSGGGSLQRGMSLGLDTTRSTNEPLRIVEETLGSPGEHMYCNTSALHGHA